MAVYGNAHNLMLYSFYLVQRVCTSYGRLYHVYRFDNLRIPRENLLNSVADVLADGKYVSSIKDPDQVYAIPWNLEQMLRINFLMFVAMYSICFRDLEHSWPL